MGARLLVFMVFLEFKSLVIQFDQLFPYLILLQQKLLSVAFRSLIQAHKSNIENSVDFVSKLKQVSVKPNTRMGSFDAESIYTNYNPQKAERILKNKLSSNPSISEKSTLSNQTLLSLTTLCNRTSFCFHYRGIFYRPKYGLSMG